MRLISSLEVKCSTTLISSGLPAKQNYLSSYPSIEFKIKDRKQISFYFVFAEFWNRKCYMGSAKSQLGTPKVSIYLFFFIFYFLKKLL